jgi:hypothetical protein
MMSLIWIPLLNTARNLMRYCNNIDAADMQLPPWY